MEIKCPYADCLASIKLLNNIKSKTEKRACPVCSRSFNAYSVMSARDQKLVEFQAEQIEYKNEPLGVLFVNNGDRIEQFPIENNETVIGRRAFVEREGLEITSRDVTMSRQHFKLILKNNQVYIQSLKPKNGTYIYGFDNQEEKVSLKNGEEVELIEDTIIVCGRTKMSFSLIENGKHLYQYKEKLLNVLNK